MRSWLRRWRWLLLPGGLILALFGTALLLAPAPVRPFDRIQLGMIANQVDAVANEILGLEQGGVHILIENEGSGISSLTDSDLDHPHEYTSRMYTFRSGEITVGFVDDRAVFMSSTSSNPRPTFLTLLFSLFKGRPGTAPANPAPRPTTTQPPVPSPSRSLSAADIPSSRPCPVA